MARYVEKTMKKKVNIEYLCLGKFRCMFSCM